MFVFRSIQYRNCQVASFSSKLFSWIKGTIPFGLIHALKKRDGDVCRITGPMWGDSIGQQWFSPTRGQKKQRFGVFLTWAWTGSWTNNPTAVGLRCHDAHVIMKAKSDRSICFQTPEKSHHSCGTEETRRGITVKPVYNDHLMGYFPAFWSTSRWPRWSLQTRFTVFGCWVKIRASPSLRTRYQHVWPLNCLKILGTS